MHSWRTSLDGGAPSSWLMQFSFVIYYSNCDLSLGTFGNGRGILTLKDSLVLLESGLPFHVWLAMWGIKDDFFNPCLAKKSKSKNKIKWRTFLKNIKCMFILTRTLTLNHWSFQLHDHNKNVDHPPLSQCITASLDHVLW